MKHYLDLAKWIPWPDGSVLVLESKRARRVRLDVATVSPALLTISLPAGDFPLATVNGRETVQFSAEGDVRLAITQDGAPAKNVWFQTVDGDDVSLDNGGAEEYTRMWERRPRDYNLERVLQRQAEAMERRFNQALHDQEKRLRTERQVHVDTRKGASGTDVGRKPAKPKAGANQPRGGVAPPPAGDGNGGAEGNAA